VPLVLCEAVVSTNSLQGLYQWPLKTDRPETIFGEHLKDLDKLRTGWKVYVEWNAAKACILIRATSSTGSEDIIEVMEGIRQATESARAHSLTAAPLYIVMPPRFSCESTIVLATVDTVARSDGKKHLYSLRFCERADDEQLKDCYPKMKKMAETNEEKLQEELSTQLALNKLFKNKMRMRVNFGRVHLTHWQTELSDLRQTFAGFVKMMGKRTRIASVFEKESVHILSLGRKNADMNDRLDTKAVATVLQKIKTKTTMFLPYDGRLAALSDVEPVHIVIFTVETSSGKRYRIEADIDKVEGGYQSGCCRAFDIEERDPSLEIISIDIEKYAANSKYTSMTKSLTIVFLGRSTGTLKLSERLLAIRCTHPSNPLSRTAWISTGCVRRGFSKPSRRSVKTVLVSTILKFSPMLNLVS
jgi:hypothetical protein